VAQSFATARFLTVQEVADLMRVSTMTVYRIIKSGELPAVRVGRSFRGKIISLQVPVNLL
jgi:excisionase family DNA binding protein